MKNETRKSLVTKGRAKNFSDKDLKDLEIVERLKSGDSKVFDYVHKKFYDYIRYHCFLSVRNQEVARDLTMEILEKVYLNIDKYTVEYTFNTWVWSIARNHVVDHIRKSKNEPLNTNLNSVISSVDNFDFDDISQTGVKPEDLRSNYADPEESMQLKKTQVLRKQFVENLLNKVNDKERAVLVHYYFDDMSYDEIASKLNMGLSAMKLTMMRAKEKLRNKLKSYDKISYLLAK